MGVIPGKEIEAVVLSSDGVPETRRGECVVGVHLVLAAAFLVVDLLEVVDYAHVPLDRRLLLTVPPLPHPSLLLPLLLLFAATLVQHARGTLWTTLAFGAAWTGGVFARAGLGGRVHVGQLG